MRMRMALHMAGACVNDASHWNFLKAINYLIYTHVYVHIHVNKVESVESFY